MACAEHCERFPKQTRLSLLTSRRALKLTTLIISKIRQYFHTRSPVTMADIDGWHTRDLMTHYSSMTILTFIASFVSNLSFLTLLAHSTHLLLRNMRWTSYGSTKTRWWSQVHPILYGGNLASLLYQSRCKRQLQCSMRRLLHDNFIQTAGIQDGASHCVKLGFSRFTGF